MPYSLDKNFYFVRVAKTAGMFLMDQLYENVPDLIDAKHNGFPPKKINGVNHGDHIKQADLIRMLKEDPIAFEKYDITLERLSNMKKFSVSRNPYTRTLSLFSFLKRHSVEDYTPRLFEEDVMNAKKRFDGYHFDQSSYITNMKGEVTVDKIFKVEDNLLQNLNEYLGLNLAQDNIKKRVNSTHTRQYPLEAYFEKQSVVAEIGKLYKPDFNNLNYNLDDYPK